MSEQWQLRAGGLEDVCFRSGTQLSVQHRLPPASLLPSQCVRMVCVAPPAAAESTWQADCGTAPPLHYNDRNQVTAKLMARHSHSHRQSELTMDSWPMKMSWSECLVSKQPGGLLGKVFRKDTLNKWINRCCCCCFLKQSAFLYFKYDKNTFKLKKIYNILS